jgi:hypothetical protein
MDEELALATPADKDAVVANFGDVYSGVDYLEVMFEDLVQGHGVKAFLYKVKGELVRSRSLFALLFVHDLSPAY